MATIRQALKFETMGDLDRGTLRVAVNDALRSMMQDLHDRPGLESKRTLTLKLSLTPIPDKQSNSNSLDGAGCEWELGTKLPGVGSGGTVLSPQQDGQFVFISDMPDAANDNTIFDEAERRQLERQDRGRERGDSSSASGT